jgi:predicted GTPase
VDLLIFRQFIDLLTGQPGKRAGSGLKSVTAEIEATRVHHPDYEKQIVLVDTPGFDDTTKTDMEILRMISDWLAKT